MSIPELLSAIKLLCMRFQTTLVTVVDDLRLDTLLRMLKTPHFSTKMNSLKEVRGQGLHDERLDVKQEAFAEVSGAKTNWCRSPYCYAIVHVDASCYKRYEMCLCVSR